MAWIWIELAVIMSVSVMIQSADEQPTPCECNNNETPQQNLVCKAEWVVKVKVLSVDKKKLKIKWEYAVNLIQLYKPKAVPWMIAESMDGTIVTKKPNKDACGIELMVGKTYILSGTEDSNGNALLSQCDSVVELVTDISPKPQHLDNLMKHFQENCDCTVEWVNEVGIYDESIDDLDLSTRKHADNCIECIEQSRCTNRVSYCRRKEEDEPCQWEPVAKAQQEEGIVCSPSWAVKPDCSKYICTCEAKPFLRYIELYGETA